MERGTRSALILPATALAFAAASVAEAQGCFVVEGESRSISIATGSDHAEVSIRTYAEDAMGEGMPSCIVSTSVKLSSFPTSRLATRPREIAEAIRDAAAELKTRECRIVVWYTNDTGEERDRNERCRTETFRFDRDSYWSSSRETSCWDA
jgi:hypothetical protein